jgi:BirA family biotin operon repressor/biotin-[acetyl-CoA-carboxylase] ligase
MTQQSIGHKIIWLKEVTSTNDSASVLAKAPNSHGVIVVAEHQSQGRGQRGNVWESKKGENLLFSIVLKPAFLKVQRQFLISKLTALAVCDVLRQYTNGIAIKWPNDIYINNDKIAGILIENSFSSLTLDTTIVGIGINLNQKEFTDEIANPTSLCLHTHTTHNAADLLGQICSAFEKRYNLLKTNRIDILNAEYFSLLYRREGLHRYFAQGSEFFARIVGVRDSGELLLETDTGKTKEFAFKEINFMI